MNRPDIDPEIAEQDAYGNTTAKNLNPEAHGFENTPAECENDECAECKRTDKREIDCPYIDEKTVLTADERLDIALSIFTERQVEEFADACAEREGG